MDSYTNVKTHKHIHSYTYTCTHTQPLKSTGYSVYEREKIEVKQRNNFKSYKERKEKKPHGSNTVNNPKV